MKKIDTGWQVALASMVGLTVGAYSMSTLMQPLLLEPLTQEFHWSRAQYFGAQLPAAILGAVVMPLLGRAADQWGLRRVHLPGVIGYGLVLILLSTLNGSQGQWYAYTLLLSAFAMFQSPPLYAKAVSAWMDKNRGIGLGVATTGNALGATIVPPIAIYLLAHYGWRDMRIAEGFMVMLVAFPAIYFFIKEPFAPLSQQNAEQRAANVIPGHSVREGLKMSSFWLLVLAFFLIGASTVSMLSNFVPLLRDHGFENAPAVTGYLLLGVGWGQFGGRIISGWMLDRYQTPKVAIVLILLAFIGVGLVALGTSVPVVVAGAAFLGLGLGAELQVAAYFSGRFFGMKNFGSLYSFIFGAFIIGNAVGGLTMGWIRDHFGSYNYGVAGAEISFLVSCLCFFLLPQYVYKRPSR